MKDALMMIALDGGAASGKSTVARILAQSYSLLHVDTGLHYRALTRYCIQEKITAEALESSKMKALEALRLSSLVRENRAYLVLNETLCDETYLKTQVINQQVSAYSAVTTLRRLLCAYQRSLVDLASDKGFKGIVMEGRDIGSVVLPNAPYKFFLYADVHLRAQRRQAEGIADTIEARDAADSQRATAPLTCPVDAIRIDTSVKDVTAVVEEIGSYLPRPLG